MLAFIEQSLVLSKREGGQWGLQSLPQEYHPIIREALREYATSGTARPVDCRVLKEFAHYANTIHSAGQHISVSTPVYWFPAIFSILIC